jgi:capsid protein
MRLIPAFISRLFTRRPAARPAPSRGGRTMDVDVRKGAYNHFGFHSVEQMRKDGRTPTQGSGDEHQKYERELILAESRRLDRDSELYQGMIDKAVQYIVGNGFKIDPKTSDPEWNAAALEEWRKFWAHPEVTGLDDGYAIEQMVCRELLLCGDVGVLKVLPAAKSEYGKIQIIEAEQIKGPIGQTIDGLSRNASGHVDGYYVSQYEHGQVRNDAAKKLGRDVFLFLVRRRRPSSSRGVPPMQAAFAMLHRITDTCDAEAIARQLQARIVASITRQNGAAIANNLSKDDPTVSDPEGHLTTKVQELEQGIFVHGEPGDEIKGLERTAPGQDFTQTIEMFMRLLGVPLGLPLEITLLNWTKSNYSQSRAVLEQAYTSFVTWQMLLEAGFYRPLYNWCIDRAVQAKRLRATEERYACDFLKPTFPWIDQLAEAEAYGAKLDRSLCSHAEALKSQGKDRDDIVAAREREIVDAINTAKRIEAATGVKVPWQPFCGLQSEPSTPPPAAEGADEGKGPASPDKPDEDEEEKRDAA